jgi:integrase
MSGAEGTRTPDPHTASVVRYQLRHSPKLPEKVIKHPGTDLIELRPDRPAAK